MDVASYSRWDAYTEARDSMFECTDSTWAPWHVTVSNDKKKARLNIISHILKQIPYKVLPVDKVKLPKRKPAKVTDKEPHPCRYVPEGY